MQTLKPNNLVIIDESGCHLNMFLPYARACGGERISMPAPFIKGNKLSIIGAISINSVESALYGEWNTDSDMFLEFIQQNIVPRLTKDKVVILDNIGFHKKEAVVSAIESTGAKILFLPPYSPEYSPIENMWSKIKQILRKLSPRSIAEFSKAITHAFKSITKSDLFGWFKHCGYKVGL